MVLYSVFPTQPLSGSYYGKHNNIKPFHIVLKHAHEFSSQLDMASEKPRYTQVDPPTRAARTHATNQTHIQ